MIPNIIVRITITPIGATIVVVADAFTDERKIAVNSLKEELRMPVILYYIEDFNIKEIAQILEITEGAVQKRLARARGKLKRNLQESEELTV